MATRILFTLSKAELQAAGKEMMGREERELRKKNQLIQACARTVFNLYRMWNNVTNKTTDLVAQLKVNGGSF